MLLRYIGLLGLVSFSAASWGQNPWWTYSNLELVRVDASEKIVFNMIEASGAKRKVDEAITGEGTDGSSSFWNGAGQVAEFDIVREAGKGITGDADFSNGGEVEFNCRKTQNPSLLMDCTPVSCRNFIDDYDWCGQK